MVVANVYGCRKSALRLIVDGGLPDALLGQGGSIDTDFLRQHQKRDINRIPARFNHAIVVAEMGFVCQHTGLSKCAHIIPAWRIQCGVAARNGALKLQPLTAHIQHRPVRQHDPFHRQTIDRERAGLVGGDQGTGSQRFDGGKTAYDHAALAHARGGDAERCGDGDRQALRDRRDRKRNCKQENVKQRIAPRDLSRSENKHEREGNDGETVGELSHAEQQRRLAAAPRQQAGDAADLRLRSRAANDRSRPAEHNHGPGICHGAAITERCDRRDVGVCVLSHRRRFSRQQRFVDNQVRGRNQPHICGDGCPGLEDHDVAGDQVGGVNLQPAAGSDHRCDDAHAGAQRLRARLRVPLEDRSERSVSPNDSEDEAKIAPVSQQRRDQGCEQENVDQRAGELAQNDADECVAPALRRRVGAKARETRRSLSFLKPLGARIEALYRLVGRNRMPQWIRRHAASLEWLLLLGDCVRSRRPRAFARG